MILPQQIAQWRTYSPTELATVASARLPFWFSALLTVLIAFYLAKFFWLLVPAGDQVEWSATSVAPSSSSSGTPTTVDYSEIAAAHLFGESSAEAAPPPADNVDAPDTRMNLKLRGTVATEDKETAHAIIAEGNGNENVYFINDPIPGGAVLHQVLPDRVILNRGGVLEALRLPQQSEGGVISTATTARASAIPRPSEIANLPPGMQEMMSGNIAKFADILRPQPYMPDGQLKGYRVYPGRDRRAFASLGLRPGDLVTEINGMALNNPSSAMEIFATIGDATQVTATIERNGQPVTLTMDVSQLDRAGGARQ